MVAAFKVTEPVLKVPPGATVPVLTKRSPMVPPAPVMVPLVAEVTFAEPNLPVTFKVPLTTLISPSRPEVLESPDKVRLPTPSRLKVLLLAETTLPAKVLPALVELSINWVPFAIVVVTGKAPMLKAPPETMVPAKLTVLVAVPVMVAPVVKLVVPAKLTDPVFRNTGAPERTVVLAKLTL